MLVKLLFLVLMVMVGIMVVLALVVVVGSVYALAALGNGLNAVHHAQNVYIVGHERLDPGFGLAAVADKQIAFLYCNDLLWRRLVRVHLRAGLYPKLYLRPVPCHFACKVIGREICADNLKL